MGVQSFQAHVPVWEIFSAFTINWLCNVWYSNLRSNKFETSLVWLNYFMCSAVFKQTFKFACPILRT